MVNTWYLTAYRPITDKAGKIIGMLYVGEKLESVASLRKAIMEMKVGKIGYVGVIGGKGEHKGRYIISRTVRVTVKTSGTRKTSTATTPSDDYCQCPETAKEGESFYHEYIWQNPGSAA